MTPPEKSYRIRRWLWMLAIRLRVRAIIRLEQKARRAG